MATNMYSLTQLRLDWGHQGSGTYSSEARAPQLVSGQTLVYRSPDPATLLYGRQYDGRCKQNKELELELELALEVEPQLD